MNTTAVIKNLKQLKLNALIDKKIDLDEIDEILECIRPYCKTYYKDLNFLQRILLIAKEDGKITGIETTAIIDSLDGAIKFLKSQRMLKILVSCFGIILLSSVVLYLLTL